jgi:hypothetical protein
MTEHMASRTLVKSPPELWAECSDAVSLARHLDQFGEIRITRLEPETAVAWEGERARGTVRIEPSGWGTKVILTAVAAEEEASAFADAAEPVEAVRAAAPQPLEEAESPLVAEDPEAGHAEALVVEDPGAGDAEPVVVDAREAGEVERVVVTDPRRAIKPATDLPARRRRFARLFGLFRAPRPQPGAPAGRVAVDRPKPEPEFKPPSEPAPAASETPATEASASETPATEGFRTDTPATEGFRTETPAAEGFRTETPATEAVPTRAPAAESSATDTPATVTPATEAALTAALDSLGQAHHRPYSRA